MGVIDYDSLDKLAARHRKWRHQYSELSRAYVSGEGDNPLAFIVGEAPGAQEEIRRRPFVGDSGIVLRDLMAIAHLHTKDWQHLCDACEGVGNYAMCGKCGGFPRQYGVANCWLTNVVKYRPPGNATPSPEMVESVRHLLREEWLAVGSPKLVIPVGAVALHAILGYRQSILAMAGRPFPYKSKQGLDMVMWPMVHPSYGLKNPSIQPAIEKDWINLQNWLDKGALEYFKQDW